MLVLNREGRFHTESAPMEICRPAIIVSFGVTARCGLKGSRRRRNRFRGRVSCLMQHGHPRFETPRSAPLKKGGWAMTIFNFDTPAGAKVCPLAATLSKSANAILEYSLMFIV